MYEEFLIPHRTQLFSSISEAGGQLNFGLSSKNLEVPQSSDDSGAQYAWPVLPHARTLPLLLVAWSCVEAPSHMR